MIEIGSPSSVALFRSHHAPFFEGSAALDRAMTLAFDRAFKADDPLATVIFFLGSRCADDFREILVLASNGHGWGATAHVRGMFERCVTAAYLHENPDAVQDFISYDFIRRWKVAQAIEKVFDLSPEDKEKRDQLKAEVDEVKDRFMITACEKCGTKRLNHTWTKLDVVSMAGKIKKMKKMADLVSAAYYLPLAQAHSTLASIIQRTGEVGEGYFAVDETLARGESDRSFQLAHLLVLNALTVQKEHFGLPELVTPIDEAFAHFNSVWTTNKQPAA
jgi:hypothetical protein